MNIFQDFRALMVAVLVILVILSLIWNQRRTRLKSGPEHRPSAYDYAVKQGFRGTQAEWQESLKPANRSERRASEFADADADATLKRCHVKQCAEYDRFLETIIRLREVGKVHRWSTFTFGKNILEELEKAIIQYTSQSANQNRINTTVSAYQWILFSDVAKAILEYSEGRGLQAIALDLIRVCEKYYKLKGLNGVLYRHKGHIHYNDRCEGMSVAILQYFAMHVPKGALHDALYPFDMLAVSEVYSDEMFRRSFYVKAIDVTYSNFMQETERTNFAAQARRDQQEHEKNRRQRAKRVTRKKRRN